MCSCYRGTVCVTKARSVLRQAARPRFYVVLFRSPEVRKLPTMVNINININAISAFAGSDGL